MLAPFYNPVPSKKKKTMGTIQHLEGKEAIEQMQKIADDASICMFCTSTSEIPFATRPMATQRVDEQGSFWFLSSHTSEKEKQIHKDAQVQLIYAQPDNYRFLSVTGQAEHVNDRKKIEEFWNPLAKNWFPEGKDDPNLTLIKVTPSEAHYWDTKDGKLLSVVKLAIGTLTGQSKDGGVTGDLRP